MSKEGGRGEVSSSKKRVGGGETTDSAERTPGSEAAWRTATTEPLPSTSTTEEVVSEVPEIRDVLTSAAGIIAQSSTGVTSEITHPVPSSSHEPPSTTKAESGVGTEAAEASPRPVIAVSSMKGPAAFFNLARKFLVTDEMCDLSALEGAIISAIDAAHLLERSKLANIVRIQTSYVAVETKRPKHTAAARARATVPVSEAQQHRVQQMGRTAMGVARAPMQPIVRGERLPQPAALAPPATKLPPTEQKMPPSLPAEELITRTKKHGKAKEKGKELRRARIIVTVKRTDEYTRWLEENPLNDISGDNYDEPRDRPTSGSSLPPAT